MTDIREILAENIRTLMRESTYCRTQNGAASYAKSRGLEGVKQTTLGTLIRPKEKRGATYPKLDTIEAVADLFGVKVTTLLLQNLGRNSANSELLVNEPNAPTYLQPDQHINDVVSLMKVTAPNGRAVVKDKAKEMAKEYPLSEESAA